MVGPGAGIIWLQELENQAINRAKSANDPWCKCPFVLTTCMGLDAEGKQLIPASTRATK